MFNVRYFLPQPKLRHILFTIYMYDLRFPEDVGTRDRLITELGQLRVLIDGNWTSTINGQEYQAVPGVALFGPNSHPIHVHGTGNFKIVGFGIQPLGWTALVDVPAHVVANRIIPVDDAMGAGFSDWIQQAVMTSGSDEALVNAIEGRILARLAERAHRLSPIVRAVQDLVGVQQVNRVIDLGEKVETSPRQLERLTKEAFGFSPKTTLRRARVRRTIMAMKGYLPVDWETQAERDFADQSHLIHEFRTFTGMTPATYLAQKNPIMDIAHGLQSSLIKQAAAGRSGSERLKAQLLLDANGKPLMAMPEAA